MFEKLVGGLVVGFLAVVGVLMDFVINLCQCLLQGLNLSLGHHLGSNLVRLDYCWWLL